MRLLPRRRRNVPDRPMLPPAPDAASEPAATPPQPGVETSLNPTLAKPQDTPGPAAA